MYITPCEINSKIVYNALRNRQSALGLQIHHTQPLWSSKNFASWVFQLGSKNWSAIDLVYAIVLPSYICGRPLSICTVYHYQLESDRRKTLLNYCCVEIIFLWRPIYMHIAIISNDCHWSFPGLPSETMTIMMSIFY